MPIPEPLPDDCLPPPRALDALLRLPQEARRDPGKPLGDYLGLTPAEYVAAAERARMSDDE